MLRSSTRARDVSQPIERRVDLASLALEVLRAKVDDLGGNLRSQDLWARASRRGETVPAPATVPPQRQACTNRGSSNVKSSISGTPRLRPIKAQLRCRLCLDPGQLFRHFSFASWPFSFIFARD